MSNVKVFMVVLVLEISALCLYSYASFHGLWFEKAALGVCYLFTIILFVAGVSICANGTPVKSSDHIV